jgi:hypothetical protein
VSAAEQLAFEMPEYWDGSPTGMAAPGQTDAYAYSEIFSDWTGWWCPACRGEFEAFQGVCPWCRSPAAAVTASDQRARRRREQPP